MASFGMKITGDKALLRKLRNLGSKTAANRVLRRATNLATTPILQAARAKAPVDQGNLKKAMAKKLVGRNFQFNGIVGADKDYVGEGGERPSKYDHLVEYGHATEDGGIVPAHPFLRPAWDESIGVAKQTYERETAAGIEREAEKG